MNIRANILLLITFLVLAHSSVIVNTITGLTDNNLVFSGTIPLTTDSLFFTYYGVDGQKDQNALKNYPLFIFVGSPGTSAQYYGISGIGPLNLNNDMTFSANPYRFTEQANVMFLDLLGSGFSFATNISNLPSDAKAFGQQLTFALNAFIEQTNLGKSSTIILAGEGEFIRTLAGLDDVDTLKGIIHFSSWPEIYAIGKYYGVAGAELKLYTESERIAVESTFTSCYTYLRNSKFLEAHQCLDTIFNFIETKTKNANLLDVRLGYNLTNFLPIAQYYFSQASTVSQWKAPSTRLFESQSGYIHNLTYVDQAKNYTKDVSAFMKDYYSVKHWFVGGQSDFISYYKGVRNWIENELSFVESDAFKKAKLDDIVIDGTTIGYGKAVKQITYTELFNSGHHILHDDPKTISTLFKAWLTTLSQEKHISTE